MSDRTDRLTALAATLQRRWGPRALRRAAPPPVTPATLPTGDAGLDGWLPAGGIPRGAISEWCGVPTCGLTTLALGIAALTQGDGGRVLWLDGASTFDGYAAQRNGVDLARLILIRPHDGQEALALLDDSCAPGRRGSSWPAAWSSWPRASGRRRWMPPCADSRLPPSREGARSWRSVRSPQAAPHAGCSPTPP